VDLSDKALSAAMREAVSVIEGLLKKLPDGGGAGG